MAEAFGVAAGVLTVIDLTSKIIKRCHHLMQTAQDAPKDLRHIFVEISSLKSVFESFQFLLNSPSEFSDGVRNLDSVDGTVRACRSTLDDLSRELEGLSLSQGSQITTGKREMLKGSLKWCLKQSKAKKLLEEIGQHKVTITLTLLDDITRDVKDIKKAVGTIQISLDISEKEKIYHWTEHTNPTSNHNTACKLHEEHTSRWIHRVEEWKQWLSCQLRTVWIHGIPGAGKTVLASYLIEQVKEHCRASQSDRHSCLYYYCSFQHGQDEAEPCLRWIVSQLCRQYSHVPSTIATRYCSNHELSMEDLKSALIDLLSRLNVLYVIIDAVDESNPREDLLDLIELLACNPGFAKIQLLVTSRIYNDIESVLRPIAGIILPMSNPIVDEDIRIFVSNALQQNKKFKRWPEDLSAEVLESLVRGAKGMFRWAVCQLDRLYRKRSIQDTRVAIQELPETLDETYERIFLEIPQDDWTATRTALLWICAHNDLPFRLGIPSNCLLSAMFRADKGLSPHKIDNLYDEDTMQEILGCLVRVEDLREEGMSTSGPFSDLLFRSVSLAHYTVSEYLFSPRIAKSNVSYFALSKQICAREVLHWALQSPGQVDKQYLMKPFYSNFERYCYEIARITPIRWESFITGEESLFKLFESICSPQLFVWNDEDLLYDLEDQLVPLDVHLEWGEPFSEDSRHAQNIYMLCFNGCLRIASKILEKRDVHSIVPSPLAYQANYGSTESLPSRRSPVTIADALGAVAMEYRDEGPYYDFFGLIRKHISAIDYLLALLAAHYHEFTCQHERFCIVSDTLTDGVNVNPPGLALTPLQVAVHRWDYAGTKLLLEAGANSNGTGELSGKMLAHIDTTWAQASPLHILRNADYGLMSLECVTGLYNRRKQQRSDIEQLLISYGARDFNTEVQ